MPVGFFIADALPAGPVLPLAAFGPRAMRGLTKVEKPDGVAMSVWISDCCALSAIVQTAEGTVTTPSLALNE